MYLHFSPYDYINVLMNLKIPEVVSVQWARSSLAGFAFIRRLLLCPASRQTDASQLDSEKRRLCGGRWAVNRIEVCGAVMRQLQNETMDIF